MKKITLFTILLCSLSLFNCCSKETEAGTETEPEIQQIPEGQIVSMRINGEEKQFQVMGRGLTYNGALGHDLQIHLLNGVTSPQQDSYHLILKLKYERTGDNIIQEINFLRTKSATSFGGPLDPAKLKSRVIVNTNTRFTATFSGSAVFDGNKVVISQGFINHYYHTPF